MDIENARAGRRRRKTMREMIMKIEPIVEFVNSFDTTKDLKTPRFSERRLNDTTERRPKDSAFLALNENIHC